MDQAEIEAGLAEVSVLLNAAHGRLVELVAAALASRCWEGAGILSCEQWVAWHTGGSPHRGAELVVGGGWPAARHRRGADVGGALDGPGRRRCHPHPGRRRARWRRSPARRRGLSFAGRCGTTTSGGPRGRARAGAGRPRARVRRRRSLPAAGRVGRRRGASSARPCRRRTSRVPAERGTGERGRCPRRDRAPFARGVSRRAERPSWPSSTPRSARHRAICTAGRRSRPAAAPAPVRRPGDGRRGPPRPSGEPRPFGPHRADPAATADRGARSRLPRAGLHDDAGPDPPPSPLGGRRTDRGVNLVSLCHRHHRLHHRGGLQIDGDPERPDGLVFARSPRPPPRGVGPRPRASGGGRRGWNTHEAAAAHATGPGDRHRGATQPENGCRRSGSTSPRPAPVPRRQRCLMPMPGVTGGERLPYARPGEPGGRRHRRQPRPRSGGGPAAGAAG